jgi:hypothetical protein
MLDEVKKLLDFFKDILSTAGITKKQLKVGKKLLFE